MSFNLSNYQGQLRESGRNVYQTIFLNDEIRERWTKDEISNDKVCTSLCCCCCWCFPSCVRLLLELSSHFSICLALLLATFPPFLGVLLW